jgi:protein-disulfide isomerase
MKRYLPLVVIGAVALVTLGSATVLYRAKRLPAFTVTTNQDQSGTSAAEPMHVLGRLSASVTIEEFGDFQCPPCGTLSEPINQLERDYQSRLCVIFRHFPLGVHEHAHEAALASEAAGMQDRFWQMHDVLYREQSVWSKAADVRPLFNSYAAMLRLNIDRFSKDMESDAVKRRVVADQEQGNRLGVKVTPTIFLNNRALPPDSANPLGLRAAVEAAMKAKSPTS